MGMALCFVRIGGDGSHMRSEGVETVVKRKGRRRGWKKIHEDVVQHFTKLNMATVNFYNMYNCFQHPELTVTLKLKAECFIIMQTPVTLQTTNGFTIREFIPGALFSFPGNRE